MGKLPWEAFGKENPPATILPPPPQQQQVLESERQESQGCRMHILAKAGATQGALEEEREAPAPSMEDLHD